MTILRFPFSILHLNAAWATNFLSLVTRYQGGYALTNVVMACVGPDHVPPTGFSLSCQDVLIFLQAGVEFQMIGISNVTDRTSAWNLVLNKLEGTPMTDDVWYEDTEDYGYLQTVNQNKDCIRKGGNAIELFLIGTIKYSTDIEENVQFAFHQFGQVFMPKGMGEYVLAHELGHALGLDDIYSSNEYGMTGRKRHWVELPGKDTPVSKLVFTTGSGDWGSESGRGFYERSDSQEKIIKKFLMYGYEHADMIVKPQVDIPDDSVRGVPAFATQTSDVKHLPIGVKTIEKKIEKRVK